MSQIFGLVQNIFDMLVTLFDFVIGLVKDIIYIATLLPKLVIDIGVYLTSFMPGAVVSVVIMCVTLTVLYRVLGRD